MKFAQLHYFLSQNIGGEKDIMSPTVQKLRGTYPPLPPINSVPGYRSRGIGVARGGKRAMLPQKYIENIVISCIERRLSKQNSVIRLKSNILAPPKFLAP